MPRSFLVKKYFAKQKPNYSELECYNGEYNKQKSEYLMLKMINAFAHNWIQL